MRLTVVGLVTATIVLVLTLAHSTSGAKRCEQITIPLCKNLGYNQTAFPNGLGELRPRLAASRGTTFRRL